MIAAALCAQNPPGGYGPSSGGGGGANTTSSTFGSSVSSAYTFSVVGGTTYATNSKTGVVDFSGADAGPVIQSAINNVASTCGRLYFKNGIYNINSMSQENTGTFVNFYAIGIPGQSGSLNCEWTLEGEAGAVLCCEAVLGPFNTGTIFNITSTAVTSIGASTNTYVGIWARPDVTNTLGPTVYLKNIAVRRPNNQRGCSTGIDMQNALTADWYNVITDYTTAYASLAVPVAGTGCSDAGHGVTTSDEVGIRSTQTGQNDNHFFNSHGVGSNVCMDILSEHALLEHSGAQFCNFGIYYARAASGGKGGVFHPSVWIDSGVGECIRPLTIGANAAFGSSLNIIGWDEEDATASTFPIWQPVYQASETNAGFTNGQINYTVVQAGIGVTHVPNLFALGTGGAGFMQVQSTSPPNFQRTGEADSFTRSNSTSLGAPWQSNEAITATVMGVLSNAATTVNSTTGVAATGAGVNSWAQQTGSDQFSQATVGGSMVATSLAGVFVNASPTNNVQTYNEYVCSTSGGLIAKRGIYKLVATVATNLVQTAANSGCAATDVLRLERVGTVLNAYYCPTGTGLLNGVCNSLDLTVSDTSNINGQPGIIVVNNAVAGSVTLGTWSGGGYPLKDYVHSIYQQPAVHPMYLSSGIAPTLTGTGACATITTQLPTGVGSQAGSFVCTGTTGASTFTITFPAAQTAPNGYRCSADDQTTAADRPSQTSSTKTTCVMTTTSTATNDVIVWNASPF